MGERFTSLLFKRIFLLLFFVSTISYGQFYHGLDVGINSTSTDFMVGESVEPSRSTGFSVGYMFERELSDRVFYGWGLTLTEGLLKLLKEAE